MGTMAAHASRHCGMQFENNKAFVERAVYAAKLATTHKEDARRQMEAYDARSE